MKLVQLLEKRASGESAGPVMLFCKSHPVEKFKINVSVTSLADSHGAFAHQVARLAAPNSTGRAGTQCWAIPLERPHTKQFSVEMHVLPIQVLLLLFHFLLCFYLSKNCGKKCVKNKKCRKVCKNVEEGAFFFLMEAASHLCILSLPWLDLNKSPI